MQGVRLIAKLCHQRRGQEPPPCTYLAPGAFSAIFITHMSHMRCTCSYWQSPAMITCFTCTSCASRAQSHVRWYTRKDNRKVTNVRRLTHSQLKSYFDGTPFAQRGSSRAQANLGERPPSHQPKNAMPPVTVSHPPIVDLADFDERRDEIVHELMKAATETGGCVPHGES